MPHLKVNRLISARNGLASVTQLGAFCVIGAGAAVAQNTVSFADAVKPILDAKCVACHACNDAPSQLDLRSRMGIERGAKKGNPYSPRLDFEPNTLLNQSPKTVEEWRDVGFFSVIEGGQQSLMGQMLALGHAHPLAENSVLPADFDGRLDSLERENYTPNSAEFSAYAEQFPLEGMPFGTTRLSDEEYVTIMQWLDEGATFDNEPLQPTDFEQAQIDEWEVFLNATDNRSKLVARYIFEHYNPGYFYFDQDTRNFFQLVRATTPPGEAVVPVDMENIRRRTSPVDEPFWYRLMIVEETPCVKQHENTIDASGDRLDRIKEIFYEEDWDVEVLPGYSQAEQNDPLNTYSAIPAKSRYKYMLIDAHYHLSQYVWAAACRGDLVVSAVQDRFWIFFEDPETSLYVNDAGYRAALAPYTAIGDAASDDFLAALIGVATFRKNRAEALQEAVARLEEDPRASIEDIWPHEMLTAFRNEDSAWILDGAVGGIPKTAWVMDFPTLQRMAWQGDVSVDLFAPIGPGLVARDSWGHMRRDTEANLLRFLPADARKDVYESWYPVTGIDEGLLTPFENASGIEGLPETEIVYETDDPFSEFLMKALEHNDAVGGDPINRPQPADVLSPVEAAFRSIVVAGDQQEPEWLKFKTLLPEASFIRVDSDGADYQIYTMMRDRDRFDQGTLDTALGHVDVSKDRVTIWPGILTGYPNFMFRMDESEVEEFAAALIAADTPELFTAVVERWGIRRTHPEFWENVNSVTDYVRRTNPVQAAVFDVNRYENH